MVKYTVEVSQFTNFVKFCEDFDDEIKVNYTKSGISTSIVDRANVSMGAVEIPNFALSEYHIDADSHTRTMDLHLISKRLKEIKGFGSMVTVNHSEKDIILTCGNYKVSIPCPKLESIRKEPRIPELKFTNVFEIGTSMWLKAVKSMDAEFALYVEEGELIPCMQEEVFDEVVTVCFDGICNVKEAEPAKSKYSVEYTLPMSKILAKIAPNMEVSFAKHYPIKAVAQSQKGEVYTYIQAPRINPDDE